MILPVAALIGLGVACCMIVGSWLAGGAPKPSLNQRAAASMDHLGTVVTDACTEIEALRIQLAGARSQAAHLEGEVTAMTLERNSWRERAEVAIHVGQGPQRTTYAPRCECAECRHVRGG